MAHLTRVLKQSPTVEHLIIKAESNNLLPKVKIDFRKDLADIETLENEDTLAILTNSNPAFTLKCSANYPIDWDFYFHENDDGSSFKKEVTASRKVNIESFDNISLYQYHLEMEIEYTGKAQIFTNFACISVKNKSLATYVTTYPQGSQNQLIRVNVESMYYKPNMEIKEVKSQPGGCNMSATVTDVNDPKYSTCWRCADAKTDAKKFPDFNECYSPTSCKTLFYKHNLGKSCLRIVSEIPNGDCSPIVRNQFNPKVLLCKNHGELLAQLFFFGINKSEHVAPKIFFEWNEVTTDDMVHLYPLNQAKLFLNQSVVLKCEVSYFYCSRGTVFSVNWKSESLREMYLEKTFSAEEDDYEAEEDIEGQNDDRSRGTYVATTSNIILSYTGEVTFTCHAPVWNTSEWINSSITYNITKGSTPTVVSVGPANDISFNSDDVNCTIICRFEGDPIENVVWTKPTISDAFYEQRDNLEEKWSMLTIPLLSKNLEGEYKCRVKSFLGEHSKSYVLKTKGNTQIGTGGYIWGIVIVLLAIVLAAGFLIRRLMKSLREQRERLRALTDHEIREFLEGNPDLNALSTAGDDYIPIEALAYKKEYEIPYNYLTIDYQNLLGSGEYGKVYRGRINSGTGSSLYYANLSDNYQNCAELQVAIKTVDPNVDVEHFKALLSEIKILIHIGTHPNIVALVAACTQKIREREVYVAIELCSGGSLFDHLRKRRKEFKNFVEYGKLKPELAVNITIKNELSTTAMDSQPLETSFTTFDLLKWTKDIAQGLSYIQEKKVIHGDLATRNVLLSEEGSAKISDFGLARQLIDSGNYVKKTQVGLPWRHMAPESIKDMTFSVKSDIWAFGVTLWEIFTLSQVPYGSTPYGLQFLMELEDGIRLPKPIYSTNDIYEFMLRCWAIDPQDRPAPYEIFPLCEYSMITENSS